MADWRRRSASFESLGGFVPSVGGMVMNGADGTAETIPRQWVSAAFFEVLGVQPIAGRTFTQADHESRADAVVLSEGLWRTRFGGDPSLIGRTIRLDGDPFTVVGIVPKTFQWPGDAAMWGLRWFPDNPQTAARRVFSVIGRMKAGVSVDAARADLAAVSEGLSREFPDTNRDRRIALERLHDAIVGSDLRRTSLLFIGVVGFVLLDLLRQRRQPAPRPGDSPHPRARRSLRPRRRTSPHHQAAHDRESRAVGHWGRAGACRGGRDP